MQRKEITKFNLQFNGKRYDVGVPFSVLGTLTESGEIEHPYFGGSETAARDLFYKDCSVSADFTVEDDIIKRKNIFLAFEGIDTVSEIFLNGEYLGKTENMHRAYSFDAKGILKEGKNALDIFIYSPIKYVLNKQSHNEVYGFNEWMRGFAHIRKAHYSFGWDWGPQLPDMGIYRGVFIDAYDDIVIKDTLISQTHRQNSVELNIKSEIYAGAEYEYIADIYSPEGKLLTQIKSENKPRAEVVIENPQLWWPNGYGGQPLYKTDVKAVAKSGETDEKSYRIGLRTLRLCISEDGYGKEFCFEVNGKKIFSMGGNIIPQDSILSNITREKTDSLLADLKKANFNTVRVWGGGYYPDGHFYSRCDELGLIVWQDFMFACTTIYADKEFRNNIREEFIQAIKRIRHHACLGLLCGNNEIEMLFADWTNYKKSRLHKRHYKAVFEKMLPRICRKYANGISYIPSSPTSGGGFKKPNAPDRGDTHFWQVWHGLKPFEEYRKHKFRFCSEFGFESFPDIKTVSAFGKGRFNIFGEAMENHQKCPEGNARILYYLSKYYLCPSNFGDFVFMSQILQNEAVKFNVEHLRRSRPVSMGALYWQVNDCWPAVSWSSIDYFGRWKALHYGAKRFFAPVIVSLCHNGEEAEIHICNETLSAFNGEIEYCIASNYEISAKYRQEVSVGGLSSGLINKIDIKKTDKRRQYLTAVLYGGGKEVSRSVLLFTEPKYFNFVMPKIDINIRSDGGGRFIDISSDAFAYYLQVSFKERDYKLSDNFIFITPLDKTVSIEIYGCLLNDDDLLKQIQIKTLNRTHLEASGREDL